MNIVVFSDTHGKTQRAMRVIKKLQKDMKIDLIIHCGDFFRDAEILSQESEIETVAVYGNCDGNYPQISRTIYLPSGKLLITHGKAENVETSLYGLIEAAQGKDCHAVCFGHTHLPLVTEYQNIKLINPGSLTLPRDGTTHGSFILLKSDVEKLEAKIIYYDDFIKPYKKPERKKIRSGKLRKIFNYSDGQ